MSAVQSYKSHARWDPAFHFFVAPVMLLNVVAVSVWYYRHYAQHVHSGMWLVLLSMALLILAIKSRSNALKVQDRLIRLEERLRLASLVSHSELVELESLTVDQYVGLRFASNPELPDLARRAVREKMTRSQIKQAIVAWRADHDRV